MLEGLPRRLGKYTLVRRLATGGMAELFLALQKGVAGFEKLVVIKRILPSMTQDAGFIEMLLHEARLAATLSHPNIVQVFDLESQDGTYFIAMEHVRGEDLRAIVRQMKSRHADEFPLEHALSVVLGVCAGLAYAHEKRDLDGRPLRIVHRDVSPQNVLVTFDGDVKLVDFGIAKSDAQDGDVGDDTRSGRLKGKVPYMSPEQACGETVDARSDVFAVGVMLFELTTGRRLFKAATEYETLKLICEREYPRPTRVRAGYSPALEAIVVRALARDRDKRFQSAGELQAALTEFVRLERIAASPLALSRFMRALFAEKLAVQDETLQRDKQRADQIDLEPASSGSFGVEPSSRLSSFGPTAASRTVTDARVAGRGRSALTMATIAAVGAIAALAVVGVTALARHAAAPPSSAAHGSVTDHGCPTTPGTPPAP